jgi:hypothetical protein
MGGHITLALRRKDGSTEYVGMWTNAMKGIFTSEAFMNGSLEPLEEQIRHILEAKEFGFGRQAPVPGDYGMIVVDEFLMRVVNWSQYDTVSTLAWYDLGFRGYGNIASGPRYDHARLNAIKYGDRIHYWDNGAVGFVVKDIDKPESVEAMAKMIEDHASEDDLRSTPEATIVLRFPAWEVIELIHWKEADFHVCKVALEEFAVLDANEKRLWDEEYRELHESDDEDLDDEDGVGETP